MSTQQPTLVTMSAHNIFFLLSTPSSSLFTVWPETASIVSPGHWLEIQNLGFHFDLLNQSLHFNKIPENSYAH